MIGNLQIANGPPLIPPPDFWGPVSNFGIPVAAVMDTQKDPEMCVLLYPYLLPAGLSSCACLIGYPASLRYMVNATSGLDCITNTSNSISGTMTGALTVYSATFMRYSLAVSPKNYLLFGCHLINFSAQATQGYRYLNYWKYVPYLPYPV